MKNNLIPRTFLSFSYTNDIKSLPGFVKGGRDKVPKEASEYQNKLITGWAEPSVKEHIERVATKAKNTLEISAREFQTPCYESGIGSFNCKFFNYDFSVTQSEEDFSQCIFTGILEVKNIETFNDAEGLIDECFEFSFDKATSSLPKSENDLKELIYNLDDNKKLINKTYEFSYENDFSLFQLVHKENKTIITVNDHGIELNFKKSEPISTMLKVLYEINKKVLSTMEAEPSLLNNL